MRCLWLEDGQIDLRRAPDPSPGRGEALVRVRLAGICGTDLQLLEGYYPFRGIPGHEFVGEVVECRGDPQLKGRRVVAEINVACEACPQPGEDCRRHCPSRSVLGILGRDGAFAELVSVPRVNLHPVPEKVADEDAVFCEPLAAALRIQQQAHLRPGQRVLLVGAGRLGQLIARTLAGRGLRLEAMAKYASQRTALAGLGLDLRDPGDIPEKACHAVIEATGSPSGLDTALRAVRPRGTVVLKSTFAGVGEFDAARAVVDEIRLQGSRCGPFEPALRLLRGGGLGLEKLRDRTFPLEKALEAFQKAARPGALKVLLRP